MLVVQILSTPTLCVFSFFFFFNYLRKPHENVVTFSEISLGTILFGRSRLTECDVSTETSFRQGGLFRNRKIPAF